MEIEKLYSTAVLLALCNSTSQERALYKCTSDDFGTNNSHLNMIYFLITTGLK